MYYGLVFIVGIVSGGVLTWLYAQKVIDRYHAAAHAINVEFRNIQGKVTAIRKGS